MKPMKLKFKRAYYCAPIIAAVYYTGHPADAANTPDYFGQGSYVTALDTPGNWSTGALPTSTNDAVIGTTYFGHTGSSTTFTLSSSPPAFGSLDFNYSNGYFAYIKGTSATGTYTLTVGGAQNSNADAPNSNDLIYYGSTPELQIASNTGTGTLNVALAQTGNIDVATASAVLRIDGVISGAYQITKTGPGTLYLSNSSGGTYGNAASANVTPVTLAAGHA